MRNITLFIILIALLSSCVSSRNFTATEKSLIEKDGEKDRMHLTTINVLEDSLLLRTPSKDLKKIKNNPTLQRLLDKMLTTMYAEEGIGIAAPQVGINRNIFLFTRINESGDKVQVAINPRIIAHSDSVVCFQRDGCLSVPDRSGNSQRYAWLEVEYYDENGNKIREKLSGTHRSSDFTGIIFQHEYDHINGRLYIDKLCE